jgi:uncharacterized repeat protein (TIGR01451 family)
MRNVRRRTATWGALVLAVAAGSPAWANNAHPPPQPPTFYVTTISDGVSGSLRSAIQLANAHPGSTIAFHVSGTGVQNLHLNGALPVLTAPVTIDGFTQPGAAPGAPLIELDGQTLAGSGLVVLGGHSTVRGLIVVRWRDDGIRLDGAGGNLVEGDFVGTDPAGTAGLGNGLPSQLNGTGKASVTVVNSPNNTVSQNVIADNNSFGIHLSSRGNTVSSNAIHDDRADGILDDAGGNMIGGALNVRNVIGGESGSGVLVAGPGTVIRGNYIGTNSEGSFPDPNQVGLEISAPNTTVGGAGPFDGNLISGNTFAGIILVSSGATVQGNVIGDFHPNLAECVSGPLRLQPPCPSFIHTPEGPSATGYGLPNGEGIIINGSRNLIGGTQAGSCGEGACGRAGNMIVFNNGTGVHVHSGQGNSVLENILTHNGGNGITVDPTNPNDDPSFFEPTLDPIVADRNQTVVSGSLFSAAGNQVRVEFFGNASCDPSGFGEGYKFLGSTVVVPRTNLAPHPGGKPGAASFSVVFPPVPGVEAITATATNSVGSTSQFSRCQPLSGADLEAQGVGATPDPYPFGTNTKITYTFHVANRGPARAKNVVATGSTDGQLFTLSSSSGTCYLGPQSFACTLGDLAPDPNGTNPVTLTATAEPSGFEITGVSLSVKSDTFEPAELGAVPNDPTPNTADIVAHRESGEVIG